ncbi:MAG: ROK family transcriptional regulator [Anaerolineales bacterium]|nr:ROK family transcriptional regulator [Anaerolineales bacterium]
MLRFLHSEVSISRAQLAALTGLNKSTISSLVEELLERGLVHEIGINSVGAGRPAMLLEINPEAGSIIGVELGVDFIFVVITDFVGKIIWRRLAQADPAEEKETTLAQTLEIVNEAIKAGRELGLRPLGLGLATPGIVNLNEGVLVFAPNLHWRDVPLCKIFSEETGLRVFVENDANAAAVGEHLFGVARQSEDFIFVFAGVGIGGGLFLNGRLYRGNNGYAGEIGHSLITSESSKAPCHCGNRGCWETYANQYSIIQRIQARLEVKRSSIIPRLMMEQNAPLSIPLIKQAADLGDAEAIETFAEAGKSMGVGIASLVNIFNPQKIVLGGPLIVAGDYLLPAIRESIVMHSLLEIHKQVEVVLSAFGPDASAIGAISMVVDDILSNPSCVERR